MHPLRQAISMNPKAAGRFPREYSWPSMNRASRLCSRRILAGAGRLRMRYTTGVSWRCAPDSWRGDCLNTFDVSSRSGLGLIRTHVELTPPNVLNSTNNNLVWDVGGGVAAFFGRHAGGARHPLLTCIPGSQRARIHVERYEAGFRTRQRGACADVLK